MNRRALPLLFVLVFLTGCSSSKGGAAKSGESPVAAIAVSTAKAVLRSVHTSIHVTGSFAAEESSDVAPAVAGRVASTPVDAGEKVKKGQVICELDRRDAQLRVEQARANLEQAKAVLQQLYMKVGWNGEGKFDAESVPEAVSAKAAYDSALASARLAAADASRYEKLVAKGDVSQSSYEKSKTQQETAQAAANSALKQYEAQLNAAQQSYAAIKAEQAAVVAAESQLAQAEKGLDDTTIRAPFDGYITSRPVSVGQWVANNAKVVTLVRIATVKLQLQLPEQRAATTKIGMTVVARIAAYPDREFSGKVIVVTPAVDTNSRTFVVEARFENPSLEIRPGMFCTAKLMLPAEEQAIFVPGQAISYDRTTDAYHVFTIVNGVAHMNIVLKGETSGDLVRILSGLTGRETVITGNTAELYEGVAVTPRS